MIYFSSRGAAGAGGYHDPLEGTEIIYIRQNPDNKHRLLNMSYFST
jgi:hypothetical protein